MKIKRNRGMSYVELIVVLSIFSVMTSVVLFNYGDFQAKVDIKNLASDIALKVVEAQKSSLSGKLPPLAQQVLISDPAAWKPSYGMYFDRTADDKSFIFFADLDQNSDLANTTCTGVSECLDKITITKGNKISKIEKYTGATPTDVPGPITVTFKRPNSGAIFKAGGAILTIDYLLITIAAAPPKTASSAIKIYPSGRIQVN